MIKINSFEELQKQLQKADQAYLLLYKSGQEQSDCAFENVEKGSREVKDVLVMYADVAVVRDIHTKYEITTAPSMVAFEKGRLKNVIKGCNPEEFYKTLLQDAFYAVQSEGDDSPSHNVTVYSTPTCSWCNTLKTHLRKHKVSFTEIDVSKDQSAAEELVRRSGQTGVPQTDIDGEWIVGFDKMKINNLLGIKG